MNGVIHLILGVQIENGKHTVNSKKSYVVSTPSCFFPPLYSKDNLYFNEEFREDFNFHPFFK